MKVRGALVCSQCHTALEVELCPGPGIKNMETCSVAVFEHSGDVVCPTCSTVVRPILVELKMAIFTMAPVPPQAQQNLVVMPGGTRN